MATKKRTATKKRGIAIVRIPLSAMKCISSYPKEKKLIIEVSTNKLKTTNNAETVDEIINEARLDYALGKYKTFSNAKELIAELRK